MVSSPKELDTVVRTLWGEARGESTEGKVAVAWVIRNRVDIDLHNDGKPDWWGEGYTGVCRKPWQFSCWNKNDPNYQYMSGAKRIPDIQYDVCQEIVLDVVDSIVDDPTDGATHYYNPKGVKNTPAWVKGATFTGKIGNHLFYKDVK